MREVSYNWMACTSIFLSLAELAYGDMKRSALITPGAVLVFELELIEVQGPAADKTAEL